MKNNEPNNAESSNLDGEESFELAGILRSHFLQDPPPKDLVANVTDEIRKRGGIAPIPEKPPLKPLKTIFLRSMMVFWPIVIVLCFLASSKEHQRESGLQRPVVQQDIQGTPDSWIRFDLLERLSQSGYIDQELGVGASSGYVYQAYWDGEDPHSWWVVAVPDATSDPSGRYYLVNQAGEIRYEEGKLPTFSSPILGER